MLRPFSFSSAKEHTAEFLRPSISLSLFLLCLLPPRCSFSFSRVLRRVSKLPYLKGYSEWLAGWRPTHAAFASCVSSVFRTFPAEAADLAGTRAEIEIPDPALTREAPFLIFPLGAGRRLSAGAAEVVVWFRPRPWRRQQRPLDSV